MKPSWLDHFYDWVDALPFHSFWFYVIVYLVSALMLHASYWLDTPGAFGTLKPQHIFDASYMAVLPALLHALRNIATRGLGDFSPSINSADKEFSQLSARFSNMPSLPVTGLFIFGVVGSNVLYLSDPEAFFPGLHSTLAIGLFMLNNALSYPFALILVYFSVSRLMLVRSTYATVEKINLYDLQPLYGLARITNQIAIAWILVANYLFFLDSYLGQQVAGLETVLILMAIMVVLAGAIFLVPLLGIRSHIQEEKNRALSQTGSRIEAVQSEIFQRVDAGQHEKVGGLRDSLDALFTIREKLQRIPVWPWNPAAPRNFASAIFLPIFVWLIQEALGRLL